MSKIIRVKNTLADNAPYTYLTTAGTVGGSVHPVRNINSAVASWAIQFGATNEETAEILLLGTADPTGTTSLLTTAGLRFEHPVDTPVYFIKYDQMVFERSTAGTAGTASPLTNGTVTVTPDSLYTQFDDTSGADSYAYKAYFRNSVLDVTSSESDWLTTAGFSFYSLAKIRERAKNKLASAKFLQTDDDQVNDWINEWTETLNNLAIDVNEDYALGTMDVAHGTDGLATVTEDSFKEVRRVWYTTNGTDWYKARKMHITDFIPSEEFNETSPYFYYQGDNIIGKNPDGTSGTARVVYYKLRDALVNDTDELPVVMRSYTKSFVDYCLAQAYYLDEKEGLGDRFMTQAERERELFKQQIAPRSKEGPSYITLTEVLNADDDLEFV
jgi:hypothetical protein